MSFEGLVEPETWAKWPEAEAIEDIVIDRYEEWISTLDTDEIAPVYHNDTVSQPLPPGVGFEEKTTTSD
jgi:hypothetical protein